MAKGSKTSALEAALQYVKNKLPQTGFFSTLDELIAHAPFEKAPLDQWKGYLQPGRTFEREGVRFPLKKEELDYSLNSLPERYKDPEGAYYFPPDEALTKDRLREIVRDSRPDLSLKVGIPHENDQIDYLPTRFPEESRIYEAEQEGYQNAPIVDDVVQWDNSNRRSPPRMVHAKYSDYAHGTGHEFGVGDVPYEESATRSTDFGPTSDGQHFDPDVISHSRTTIQPTLDLNETVGPGGLSTHAKLMRLIEEIQSDRHQKAADRWTQNRDPSVQDSDLRAGRRGYRTPEEERSLVEQQNSLTGWLEDQYEQLRRSGNTPDIQAAETAAENISKELDELRKRVPDAPFKDPVDYATLELKNQMLNAAKQGQDYLGVIRGQDVSDRFSHGPDERAGTAYTYDKVYRSALNKLAKQYGIEVRDVPTTMKSSVDVATPTMREHHLETPADALRDFREYADVGDPEDIQLHLERMKDIIQEMQIPYSSAASRAEVSLENFTRELEGHFSISAGDPFQNGDVLSWWNQLKDDLGEAHSAYADQVRAKAGPMMTHKAFPSMVLTPEIREKILKAGVPIWGLSAMTAGTLAGLGANEDEQGFADGGIARLRKLAESVGTSDTVDRRKRILAGLASQWYGVNPDTNDVELLGGASLLPKIHSRDELHKRYEDFENNNLHDPGPGILDEIESMFLGTKKASAADDRLTELKRRIQGGMGLSESRGFEQNFDDSLGVMLGQLPVPTGSKVRMVEKLPFAQRLKRLAMEAPNAVAEWFNPTVDPGIKNYVTGATVGGGIGALADSAEEPSTPPSAGMAEGGSVTAAVKPLHEMLDLLKSRLDALTPGSLDMPSAGDNRGSGSGFEDLQMKAKGGKISAVAAILKKMHDLGLGHAIDDFKLDDGSYDVEDMKEFIEDHHAGVEETADDLRKAGIDMTEDPATVARKIRQKIKGNTEQ